MSVEGFAACDLGMGCEEAGACYAERMGEPRRCGMPTAEPAVCGDVAWCGLPAGHELLHKAPWHAVTADGVYEMPAEAYHADPVLEGSLSSSGARRLLPPSCPAKFQWWRENDEPSTRDQERGSAAHRVLLGVGPDVIAVDAADWRTKAAREAAAAAREQGLVPVLAAEYDRTLAMVEALREHPTAGALFAPDTGVPEAVLVWTDQETGVRRRAMLDWFPNAVGGRILLPDYKTTTEADRDAVERTVARWRYHMQLTWYRDGLLALGLAESVACFDVFQEREAPYLVHVAELDERAIAIGAYENSRALAIYAECERTGIWPGFGSGPDGNDPTLVGLPAWEERKYEELV